MEIETLQKRIDQCAGAILYWETQTKVDSEIRGAFIELNEAMAELAKITIKLLEKNVN